MNMQDSQSYYFEGQIIEIFICLAIIGCNFVIFEWIVFKLEHDNLHG
jgi:hypothetical protein